MVKIKQRKTKDNKGKGKQRKAKKKKRVVKTKQTIVMVHFQWYKKVIFVKQFSNIPPMGPRC